MTDQDNTPEQQVAAQNAEAATSGPLELAAAPSATAGIDAPAAGATFSPGSTMTAENDTSNPSIPAISENPTSGGPAAVSGEASRSVVDSTGSGSEKPHLRDVLRELLTDLGVIAYVTEEKLEAGWRKLQQAV